MTKKPIEDTKRDLKIARRLQVTQGTINAREGSQYQLRFTTEEDSKENWGTFLFGGKFALAAEGYSSWSDLEWIGEPDMRAAFEYLVNSPKFQKTFLSGMSEFFRKRAEDRLEAAQKEAKEAADVAAAICSEVNNDAHK